MDVCVNMYGDKREVFEVYAGRNGKFGISMFNHVLVKAIYDDVRIIKIDGYCEPLKQLLQVKKDNLWYIVNDEGRIVTPTGFKSIEYGKQGLLVVGSDTEENKLGVINYKGEFILDFKYRSVEFIVCNECVEGIIVTEEDTGKVGMFNNKGERIIPSLYTRILEGSPEDLGILKRESKEKLIIACIDKGSVVYNLQGKVRVSTTLDCERIEHLAGGNYLVGCEDEKGEQFYGIIDCKGEEVIGVEYDYIKCTACKDVWVVTRKEDLAVGVVNSRGDFIIPLGKYEEIIPRHFVNGITDPDVFCARDKRGEIEVIDYAGKSLVVYTLANITKDTFGEYVMVRDDVDEEFRMLDTVNWELNGLHFSEYSEIGEGYILAKSVEDNVYNIYDSRGEKVTPYDIAEVLTDDGCGTICILCTDGNRRTLTL